MGQKSLEHATENNASDNVDNYLCTVRSAIYFAGILWHIYRMLFRSHRLCKDIARWYDCMFCPMRPLDDNCMLKHFTKYILISFFFFLIKCVINKLILTFNGCNDYGKYKPIEIYC